MAGAPTELCCNEKREISPPIRVMFVRYVSLFRGRAVGRSKNTRGGGGQVSIQGLLKENVLLLFLLKSGRAIAAL